MSEFWQVYIVKYQEMFLKMNMRWFLILEEHICHLLSILIRKVAEYIMQTSFLSYFYYLYRMYKDVRNPQTIWFSSLTNTRFLAPIPWNTYLVCLWIFNDVVLASQYSPFHLLILFFAVVYLRRKFYIEKSISSYFQIFSIFLACW